MTVRSHFFRKRHHRVVALALALAIAGTALPAARATPLSTWTGATSVTWSDASNWDNGAPDATIDAALPNPLPAAENNAITLGTGALAHALFVQGGDYANGLYTIQSGDLTLSDQLWIDKTSAALCLFTAAVTTPNGTVGASADATSNELYLNPTSTLTVTDRLNIGWDGTLAELYVDAGAAVTAGTLAIGGQATSTANAIYAKSGATINATTFLVGDGGTDNYVGFDGGTLNAGTTILGNTVGGDRNELDVLEGGSATVTGPFTVGLASDDNWVYVGYVTGAQGVGTLTATGGNDIVIGANAGAERNMLVVDGAGSTLTTDATLVVGKGGANSELWIQNGAVVTSVLGRLGVEAGADNNTAEVTGAGSSWSTNGSLRVGGDGSSNSLTVSDGGVINVGGNAFVGYGASSNGNTLTVTGAGSQLVVVPALIVSRAGGTGNMARVNDGGIINAASTLVGAGGTLAGDGGTVWGNVLVGTGGVVAPGDGSVGSIGVLSINGDLDLAPSIAPFLGQHGTLAIDVSGASIDQVTVAGLLNVNDTTLHLDVGFSGWLNQAYVIASYGSLTGTFATVENLPLGMLIDYDFLGLHQIAVLSAVPEIDPAGASSVLALVAGALGLLERRTRRKLG
jgi:T5SS/PEP-CTERM-associated repeat protein